jgi:DNA-binding XRE family transcriptional regulator
MQETYRLWGTNIENGRKALGLLQYQLADAVGVRPSTICRWEQGQSCPTDAHKVRIAEALFQDVRQLFPLTRGVAA